MSSIPVDLYYRISACDLVTRGGRYNDNDVFFNTTWGVYDSKACENGNLDSIKEIYNK